MSIDELATQAGLPVRTIREYQTVGVLPPPERRGRVGIYRELHLQRLALIGRLKRRGYSLAGIRDLLDAWADGGDLGEVLGLAPDELIHVDEAGTPANVDQLARLLPQLVPERIGDVLAAGLIEACGPDRYCVPSPSLLQLAVDALEAGYEPDQMLGLVNAIRQATAAIADATIELLGARPAGADPERFAALAARGRGLLSHAVGRLTTHTIGRKLGIEHEEEVTDAFRELMGAPTP